jgi:hypothetical protein
MILITIRGTGDPHEDGVFMWGFLLTGGILSGTPGTVILFTPIIDGATHIIMDIMIRSIIIPIITIQTNITQSAHSIAARPPG